MSIVTLIIGALALILAWTSLRKQSELKERIAQVNSRIYQLRQANLEREEELQQEITALRFEVMKLSGNMNITPDMTIDQIAMMHPLATQVLAGFHIGGCSSCSVDGEQTLEDAVLGNGRELEPILVALNNLVGEKKPAESDMTIDDLKFPNVELTF